VLKGISSPEIRLSFLNRLGAKLLFWEPDHLTTVWTDFGAPGLASKGKQSHVCGCPLQEGGQLMKSQISVHDRATLASEIAALAEATLADLKRRWRVLYGTEAAAAH
jgi:hypothetical protein